MAEMDALKRLLPQNRSPSNKVNATTDDSFNNQQWLKVNQQDGKSMGRQSNVRSVISGASYKGKPRPQSDMKSFKSLSYYSDVDNPQFILYMYRWVNLVIFSGGLLSSGFFMVGFSPIAATTAAIYGIADVYVQLTVILFLLMYVPANFVVIRLLDTHGIRRTLMIGAILTIVGGWIRQLTGIDSLNFYPVLVGTLIGSFGQAFFLNSPSKLASVWFGDNERALATSIASLSFPLGCLLGFIMPILFVNKDLIDNQVTGRKKVAEYLFVQNVIITLLSFPAILWVRNIPPSQPSAIAGLVDVTQFISGSKELAQNKNFVLLFFVFSLIYGIYGALPSIISQLTEPYAYTDVDNAIFGSLFLVGGVISSFVVGVILDKFQNYKQQTTILCILSSIFSAFMFYCLPSKSTVLFGFNIFLLGAAVIPMLAVAYPFACELTYPLGEAFSNGMLMTLSLFWGAILSFITLTIVVIKENELGPNLVIACCFASALIATAVSFFIKEELRRLGLDEVRNSVYIEESFIKNQPMDRKASILMRSGIVDNQAVQFEFQFENQQEYEEVGDDMSEDSQGVTFRKNKSLKSIKSGYVSKRSEVASTKRGRKKSPSEDDAQNNEMTP